MYQGPPPFVPAMTSPNSAYRRRRYFHIVSKMHQKVLEVRQDGHLIVMSPRHQDDRQLFYEDDQGILRSKVNDSAIDVPGVDTPARVVPYQPWNATQQFCFHGNRIANLSATHIVLDIARADHNDGAEVLGCNSHNKPENNQSWMIEYA